MPRSQNTDLRKLKRELAKCRRSLKDAQAFNERLRSAIGYEELEGWKPDKRIESQYGWVFAWLNPLTSFMNGNLERPLSPSLRNQITNIVTAIIAQLAVHGKYGIKLPHDPHPLDLQHYVRKQTATLNKAYPPCEVCGEDRITHECHILPRADGGQFHKDNLFTLCPLHHHLFDHARLSEYEWNILAEKFLEKSASARVFALEVRLPELRAFWDQSSHELGDS